MHLYYQRERYTIRYQCIHLSSISGFTRITSGMPQSMNNILIFLIILIRFPISFKLKLARISYSESEVFPTPNNVCSTERKQDADYK